MSEHLTPMPWNIDKDLAETATSAVKSFDIKSAVPLGLEAQAWEYFDASQADKDKRDLAQIVLGLVLLYVKEENQLALSALKSLHEYLENNPILKDPELLDLLVLLPK